MRVICAPHLDLADVSGSNSPLLWERTPGGMCLVLKSLLSFIPLLFLSVASFSISLSLLSQRAEGHQSQNRQQTICEARNPRMSLFKYCNFHFKSLPLLILNYLLINTFWFYHNCSQNILPSLQQHHPTTCSLFTFPCAWSPPEPTPFHAMANHIALALRGNYFYNQLLLALLLRHRRKHGGAHNQSCETTSSTVSQFMFFIPPSSKCALAKCNGANVGR